MPLVIDRCQDVGPLAGCQSRSLQDFADHRFGVADQSGQKPAVLAQNGQPVLFPEMAEVAEPDAEEVAVFAVALAARTHQLEKPLPALGGHPISLRAASIARFRTLGRDEAAILEPSQQRVKGAPAETAMRPQRSVDDRLEQVAVHGAVHQFPQNEELVHSCNRLHISDRYIILDTCRLGKPLPGGRES